MASRLAALLPRLVALTVIWLLATSTITFAAGSRTLAQQPEEPAAEKADAVLTVPDVRRQAYVFAKGILEDGGFAWRVEGPVQGYAANLVADQVPAPGVRVADNGTPTVVLRLERNAEYEERGLPQNAAPYPGDPVVLARELEGVDEDEEAEASAGPAEATPAPPKPAAKPKPAPKPKAAAKPKSTKKAGKAKRAREPEFEVPGAPPEPLDEMPLVERARLLRGRIAAHKTPTPRLVKYWLYQHAWIVTGARFGWSGGAPALRILIAVDEDMQARWRIGARSEAVARATLAYVVSRSR
jgi:hypothetical protein